LHEASQVHYVVSTYISRRDKHSQSRGGRRGGERIMSPPIEKKKLLRHNLLGQFLRVKEGKKEGSFLAPQTVEGWKRGRVLRF